ncbi:Rieske 2Fe-2S domain-containing protein [Rhodococcus sp. BP-349]|uniref:aromatic ring-hydroxylating oxygenase subunit alpha n=1 Tax=unclassified Rhodococcus (in: high G+C Gram-positive bacteria) TaxID=192944 RepID=UPI001C9B0991|nr:MULTISPECIES: Rieske 2Fe-2S domain-containing protein [unclassified Rhodococcus (in: high G+C Gram-positive bacteria)]MBY6537931.1 Rieske 2Fe-2S domain-containing protein [Rhodococcus sp. BP-363]MBY6542268.1 Rieske 2Fe-2S domain-containing protein [Rhodococcus sp. BP-369]MBY6561498.1 Rieske 2Fe-2S domain-containing protein [Rhodococcus sp. BP-370]MBY6575790.1 Rieske 2Fe-2S domain-containing protein [Rhodococcus sp. BP-364]MBY6585091.1 Rieske 2Fe-2S domain-containing protein [Rhodococcus sp.
MSETREATPARKKKEGNLPGRQDWSSWPLYQAAGAGFRGYWYPVAFSSKVGERPLRVMLLGEDLFVIRDGGVVRGMANRCPHRGVPLSYGNKQFPGTISCVYHGWTFDLESGDLKAAITDGPKSPICGKVTQPTYHVEERLGMVWVFVGDGEEPHPIDEQLPEELVGNAAVIGARIQAREGNWRFACENGYDEGHAKYLHRTALWRVFKSMPVWNTTKIVKRGRWIYRVQLEQFWDADFPGLGKWSSQAWYKTKPPKTTTNIGNTGSHREVNEVIAAQEFPGFASVSMPGVLRIAYPTFIHYEFYVPVDEDNHLYVGVLADFKKGWRTIPFYFKYLGAVRWLFHGQFSGQDKWMVEVTDAPPEKLYRPDDSLLQWRKLAEDTTEDRIDALADQGIEVSGPA